MLPTKVTHALISFLSDGSAYASTSKIWDDGILDPRQTRKTLALALAMSLENSPSPETIYGVFRM